MQNAKLTKLIKCLNMASSSHDGEAVNAVRLATKLLKDEGWTWEGLLTSKVQLIADPFTMERPPEPVYSQTPPSPSPQPPVYRQPRPSAYYTQQPRRPRQPRAKKPAPTISLDDLFGPGGPTI